MCIGLLYFRPNAVVEFKSLATDDISQGRGSIFGDAASDTRSLFRSNKGPAAARGASYAKQLAAQARGSTAGPDQALDQNCLDNFIKDLSVKSPKTLYERAQGGGQQFGQLFQSATGPAAQSHKFNNALIVRAEREISEARSRKSQMTTASIRAFNSLAVGDRLADQLTAVGQDEPASPSFQGSQRKAARSQARSQLARTRPSHVSAKSTKGELRAQRKSQAAFSRPAPSLGLRTEDELLAATGPLADAVSRGAFAFDARESLSPRASMKSQKTLPRRLQLDGDKSSIYHSAAPNTESNPYLRSGKVPMKLAGGRKSQGQATAELRDFEAVVQAFAEANFADTGKQNIGYMAQDEQQLVHHGAHSMPRQQVLARNAAQRAAFGQPAASAYGSGPSAQARGAEQRLQSRSALSQFAGTRGDQDKVSQAGSGTAYSRQAYRTSKQLGNLIGEALERKQVSQEYRTSSYPHFMKQQEPQGPCALHDEKRDAKLATSLGCINKIAKKRFNHELETLKRYKDYEQQKHVNYRSHQHRLAAERKDLDSMNKGNNLAVIQAQIEDAQFRKQEFDRREKRYYKPHFGPEENEELVALENERRENQRRYVHHQLQNQIHINNSLADARQQMERTFDQRTSHLATKAHQAELEARRNKNAKQTQALKTEWAFQVKEKLLRQRVADLHA